MEHRSYPRIPVHLPVHLADREGQLGAALIDSLSGGGVFIRTSRPLPIGTELVMDIYPEEGAKPVRIRGQVVWERLIGRSDPQDGMGVRFLEPFPDDLRNLLTAKVA